MPLLLLVASRSCAARRKSRIISDLIVNGVRVRVSPDQRSQRGRPVPAEAPERGVWAGGEGRGCVAVGVVA